MGRLSDILWGPDPGPPRPDVSRLLERERAVTAEQTRQIHRLETKLAAARADTSRVRRTNENLRQALDIREVEVCPDPAVHEVLASSATPTVVSTQVVRLLGIKVARYQEWSERLEAEVGFYRSSYLGALTRLIELGDQVVAVEFGADQLGVPAAPK